MLKHPDYTSKRNRKVVEMNSIIKEQGSRFLQSESGDLIRAGYECLYVLSSIISIVRWLTICYDKLALVLGVILQDWEGHEL
jgi:hypothetical protein